MIASIISINAIPKRSNRTTCRMLMNIITFALKAFAAGIYRLFYDCISAAKTLLRAIHFLYHTLPDVLIAV